MALVSSIRNRRKPGTGILSGQAEACETRALLSAAPVAVVDGEQSCAEKVSIESPDGNASIADEGYSTPGDPTFDGSTELPFYPDEGWDPTWLYPTLMPTSEESPVPSEGPGTLEPSASVAPEGWTDEQWQAWNSGPMTPEQMEQLGIVFEPFDEWNGEATAETPYPEGWDPSWVFPGPVTGVDGELLDVVICTSEYPEDPSIEWAYGPGGEDPNDGPFSEDGPVDGEVVDVPLEDSIPDGEPVKDYLDWTWVLRGPASGTEGDVIIDDSFVFYPFDPLPGDASVSIDNEFKDGTDIFVDGGDISSGGDEPEIYFAMSFGTVGGSDLQRSQDAVELEPVPMFSFVADRTTALFDGQDTAVSVGAQITQTEEPAPTVSEPVKQPVSAVLRSKSRGLSVASVTTASEELNDLTPLLDNSDEPVAPDVKPADPDELPSDETVSVIENHDASSTEGFVAADRSTPVSGLFQVRNAARSGSLAIDQFMTQYAQNSFMS